MDLKLDSPLVLVTGAAGWLGANLVQALARGLPGDPFFASPPLARRVRCLVLPGQDVTLLQRVAPAAEIFRGDLTRPGDCAAFCANATGALLLHTAGVIHPRRVKEFYAVNVEGTRAMLDAGVAAGVRRAVIVSSNSPCGCNPDEQHLFDERAPYRPYMNYGRSKMQMERLALGYQQRGQLEVAVIRPPWFYGPNQPPRQRLFFEMVRDGKAPIVGPGTNRRSMAYVDNLVQGVLLAATTPKAAGETYWIADERAYPMTEIIDTIERLMEKEFSQPCTHGRLRLPSIASEVARVVDQGLQSVGRYHQKIHVLSEMNQTIACSVAKARAELGYRPQIALEEGMRRSLAEIFGNGKSTARATANRP